ncbi:MAG: alpha/beta hydrolase, partial [Flammeovirgaceae bacterium]|nr:alpha/beta hydrolase [Flammeovirgaceae bacterium]
DHGVDTTEQLLNFTADRLWESSKEALAIGSQLGEKVILISTSTGGTMALALATAFPDKVFAMINMSPNIEINNPLAYMLNNPWGLQIARLNKGGNYQEIPYEAERKLYWNEKYRLESLVQLQEILEDKMTVDTFQKVTQPTLTLYYYKNEQEQDPTVKVSAMLVMHEALGTPKDLKIAKAIPTAGAHVMGSSLVSEDLESVQQAIEEFAVNQLKMKKIN